MLVYNITNILITQKQNMKTISLDIILDSNSFDIFASGFQLLVEREQR